MRLVLLVTQSDYFLSHRLALARAAIDHGLDVHLVTRVVGDRADLESTGVTVHDLPLPRGLGRPWRDLTAVARLARLYRHLAPQLVHHISVKGALLGTLAARMAHVPAVVNTYTGLGALSPIDQSRSLLFRSLAWRWLRLATAHKNTWSIFQNRDDRQVGLRRRITSFDRTRMILGSGVDTNLFQPAPFPSNRCVMLAARMIRAKGIESFVEAARRLRHEFSDVQFALVGPTDPNHRDGLTARQLRSWEASHGVQWWARQDDMRAAYARATLLVLPTVYGEGLPKVLLEGAAMGRPLIATDVPGCRDIVVPERTGMLVRPRCVTSLASAISGLLRRPQRCRQMGVEARALSEKSFSDQVVVKQYLSLFDQIAVKTRRAPSKSPSITRPRSWVWRDGMSEA